jgi:hypothetical protein
MVMKDPIELVCAFLVSIVFNGDGETILVRMSILAMVICAIVFPNLMSRVRRAREKKIALQSRTLIRRIESLIPIYKETAERFVNMVEQRVVGNPGIVAMARQIPQEMKVKAERDFCLQDSSRPETIAVLQMEWTRLLNKQQGG